MQVSKPTQENPAAYVKRPVATQEPPIRLSGLRMRTAFWAGAMEQSQQLILQLLSEQGKVAVDYGKAGADG